MRASLIGVILLICSGLISACGSADENTIRSASSIIIGKWKIDHIYAYGAGGSKNDEAAIKKLIGTEIHFSSNSIRFGHEAKVKSVYYKISKSSDGSFLSDINWLEESTAETDLNVQSLEEISLYEDDQYTSFYYGDGNITYYTEKGEVILDHDGDLFVLVKQ